MDFRETKRVEICLGESTVDAVAIIGQITGSDSTHLRDQLMSLEMWAKQMQRHHQRQEKQIDGLKSLVRNKSEKIAELELALIKASDSSEAFYSPDGGLEKKLMEKDRKIEEMELQKRTQDGLIERLVQNVQNLSIAVSSKLGMKFDTPVNQLKRGTFIQPKSGSISQTKMMEAKNKYKRCIEGSALQCSNDKRVKKTLLYSQNHDVNVSIPNTSQINEEEQLAINQRVLDDIFENSNDKVLTPLNPINNKGSFTGHSQLSSSAQKPSQHVQSRRFMLQRSDEKTENDISPMIRKKQLIMETDEKDETSDEKQLLISPMASNLFQAAGIEEEEENVSSPFLTPKLNSLVVPNVNSDGEEEDSAEKTPLSISPQAQDPRVVLSRLPR